MDRRPYTIWWRKLLQGCDYTFHYFLPPPIQNTHFDQASLCQNSNSLKHVPEWIQIIREHVGDIPIFFIGNNIDLAESRIVSREEGINLVTKYNLYAFSEISTKTGENVEGIFQTLSDIIIKRWE